MKEFIIMYLLMGMILVTMGKMNTTFENKDTGYRYPIIEKLIGIVLWAPAMVYVVIFNK